MGGLFSQEAAAVHPAERSRRIKHRTDTAGLFAYERDHNWFYWRDNQTTYPNAPEVPRPHSQASRNHEGQEIQYAPLSDLNTWPRQLSNQSLFPYLLPCDITHPYRGFYDFVKRWYQSSCAIVYYAPDGEQKIIGSGGLVIFNRKYCVATARHVFNNIPRQQLYARFFRYTVRETNEGIAVLEHYLDVPIATKIHAYGGLDAGYLNLSLPKNKYMFFEYAKSLPMHPDLLNGNIPEGHYAMFHFAGGRHHQISIGEILGHGNVFTLHNDIFIQAGPGASGALIIHQRLDKVESCGVSIYRLTGLDYTERRLISFHQFHHPLYTDPISAPYLGNDSINLPYSGLIRESGYEYIRWSENYYQIERPAKPAEEGYRTRDNHSCHHIIPAPDLYYLWDYFSPDLQGLDQATLAAIDNRVAQDAKGFEQNEKAKLERNLQEYYINDNYTKRLHDGLIDISARKERFIVDERQRYQEAEFFRLYGRFQHVLATLCLPAAPGRNRLVWAKWNLFKGWEGDYRQDDPIHDGADRSEKKKPAGFSKNIWELLKGKKGLFAMINLLCRQKQRNTNVEAALYRSLEALAKEWKKMLANDQDRIHPYIESEWELVGERDGKSIYRVRQPS